MPPEVSAQGRRTEIAGVNAEDLHTPSFPWEFRTDTGLWVRLHDMDFLGLEHQVLPPTLTLRFAYSDLEWTPPDFQATPVAALRFEAVALHRWEDLPDPVGDPAQMVWASYVTVGGLFQFVTTATQLVFSAGRLAVSMEAERPRPSRDGG